MILEKEMLYIADSERINQSLLIFEAFAKRIPFSYVIGNEPIKCHVCGSLLRSSGVFNIGLNEFLDILDESIAMSNKYQCLELDCNEVSDWFRLPAIPHISAINGVDIRTEKWGKLNRDESQEVLVRFAKIERKLGTRRRAVDHSKKFEILLTAFLQQSATEKKRQPICLKLN